MLAAKRRCDLGMMATDIEFYTPPFRIDEIREHTAVAAIVFSNRLSNVLLAENLGRLGVYTSRFLSLDGGIVIDSRYLAIVRRATLIP